MGSQARVDLKCGVPSVVKRIELDIVVGIGIWV